MIEFDKVGTISLKNTFLENCEVIVYGDENDPPHFHIESIDQHVKVCVEIYNPKQYTHNERYTMKLSKDDCIILDNWLKSKVDNKYFSYMTNWEYIKAAWGGLNENYNSFSPELMTNIQPDYSLMSGF